MKSEILEAIYEHGNFRLVSPGALKLVEGQKVRLMVEPIEKPDDMLGLAGRVYEGLTEDQIDSIEQHIQRRGNFFGERAPL